MEGKRLGCDEIVQLACNNIYFSILVIELQLHTVSVILQMKD